MTPVVAPSSQVALGASTRAATTMAKKPHTRLPNVNIVGKTEIVFSRLRRRRSSGDSLNSVRSMRGIPVWPQSAGTS